MKILSLFFLALSLPAAAFPRVLSLSPELTEIVCRLDARAALVGRSDACDMPESVRELPSAGRFNAPSLETVLRLKPDVVLLGASRETAAENALRQLRIRVLKLPTESLDDYAHAVKSLGALLGKEREADMENERIRQITAEYRKRYAALAGSQRPSVLLVIWDQPLTVAGRRSVLHDMIELVGGRNAAEAFDTPSFACSAEWVLKTRPDVLIFPGMWSADTEKRSMNALEKMADAWDGRVCDTVEASLIFRLGPRFTEGLAQLERAIHTTKTAESVQDPAAQ